MSTIASRLKEIKGDLPVGVSLVAVSKFHPVDQLMQAYDAGQRLFGESRVQELLLKIGQMPSDIVWHFIGHLQTNKVRQIVGRVSLIESVDSERLLDLIDAESVRAGVTSRVLMQLHVAREETKFGFDVEELTHYFAARRFESLKATHICGVMGMASNTDDVARIADDFKRIRGTFDLIKNEIAPDLRGFDIVSMGMSDDRHIAVECGSTMVRVGTAIFGLRR